MRIMDCGLKDRRDEWQANEIQLALYSAFRIPKFSL
jgi:hypothetical protein